MGMFEFIFLSNLLIEKGVWLVLDACKELNARNYSFVCHIVGAESREIRQDEIINYIRDNGIQDTVRVHGPLYGVEKECFLDHVDAMIFPSYNECFPMVLLEAMKHALPVISTRIAAIPDIVEDGNTGILVEPRELASLVSAMAFFLENPKKAAEMGKRARERQRRLYSFSNFERSLCDILHDVGNE